MSVTLVPRLELGIVFVRVDLPASPEVVARLSQVVHTTHATTLAQGPAMISTTEHLLAALWVNGVTHCTVEVHGSELPIFDGSAHDWQAAIDSAGVVGVGGYRPVFALREAVQVDQGDAFVRGESRNDEFYVESDVDFGRTYLPKQVFKGVISRDFWRVEMADARTFTLEEWIEPLRAQNLICGGSEANAIVLYSHRPSSALRFSTELARHKALDLLGDVALLFGENGGVLHATLLARRAGHGLHRRWMEECARRGALVQVG